jgi:hypothetical protein
MSQGLIRLTRVGLSVFVVAGLLFGGRTLLASSLSERTCDFNPPSFVGSCTSQQDCQQTCEIYWTQGPVEGTCDHNNCCSCVI